MATLIVSVLALLSAGLIGAVIFSRLYVKTPANMAFIRTGLGGKKVIIDRGATVLPLVQNIQWLSLETFKLKVLKANKEAFITKDRFRVDIGSEFYVKVEPSEEAVERASRSLGERGLSAEGIKALVEEKLISALRSEAAKKTLVELHEDRRGFAKAVMINLKEALVPNGLTLEEVSIFYLDQTDKNQLDPNNVFDAEGLRQITLQTSERMRERNEIERNTEVAIKRKDVEAVKFKLALDQERSFAEAEQIRQIETDKLQKVSETAKVKYEQERVTREAEIEKDRMIREMEIRRDTYLIEEAKLRETKEIEKRRAIEEAEREKERVIILKETERIREEVKRHEAEASKEEAAQNVLTAQERVKTERIKEIALIDALRDVEVAERKLRATELLAAARRIEGESEAYAQEKLRTAENVLDEKIIKRDITLELISKSPEILSELMSPAKHIDSIRVINVDGLGGNGGSQTAVDGVMGAILKAGAAFPLLKELLDFSRIDADSLKRAVSEMPGIRELRRK